MCQSTVRFLPKKNNTDTETIGLVYNKFKFEIIMPIRQDDNQPNRRFGIVNIILIGVGALLLFSSLFPNQNMQIPRVLIHYLLIKLMMGKLSVHISLKNKLDTS